jgi:integrase
MPSGTAQKIYNQARGRAGIELGSGFHTLRHYLATQVMLSIGLK